MGRISHGMEGRFGPQVAADLALARVRQQSNALKDSLNIAREKRKTIKAREAQHKKEVAEAKR